jgi:hypothetical protein
MHPGWLSSLPSGWRNLLVFVIAALALSVILEKEFPEVARDELMFGKLEEVARDILGFGSEQPGVPTVYINPRSLGIPDQVEEYCRGQYPFDTEAFLKCEKRLKP